MTGHKIEQTHSKIDYNDLHSVFRHLRIEKHISLFSKEEMEPADFLLLSQSEQNALIPKKGPRLRLIHFLLQRAKDDLRVVRYNNTQKNPSFGGFDSMTAVPVNPIGNSMDSFEINQTAAIRKNLVYWKKIDDLVRDEINLTKNDQNNPNLTKNNQNNPNLTKNDQNNPNLTKNDQNNPNLVKNDQNNPNLTKNDQNLTKNDKNVRISKLIYETQYTIPTENDSEDERINQIYFSSKSRENRQNRPKIVQNDQKIAENQSKSNDLANFKGIIIFFNDQSGFGFAKFIDPNKAVTEPDHNTKNPPNSSAEKRNDKIYVHASALVDPSVKLAKGLKIEFNLRINQSEANLIGLKTPLIKESDVPLLKKLISADFEKSERENERKAILRAINVKLIKESIEKKEGTVCWKVKGVGFISGEKGNIFFEDKDIVGDKRKIEKGVRVKFCSNGEEVTRNGIKRKTAKLVEFCGE